MAASPWRRFRIVSLTFLALGVSVKSLLPLLIQRIEGALGGIAVGLLKKLDLSKLVATISGLIGGVAGGQLAGIFDLITKIFGEGGGGLAGHDVPLSGQSDP